MPRLAALLIAVTFFGGSARAGDPHVELIERLRLNGMPDLSIEYIGKVRPTVPKDLAMRLSAELCKCRLALAEHEPEPARQLRRLAEARAELPANDELRPVMVQVLTAQARAARAAARRAASSVERQDLRALAVEAASLAVHHSPDHTVPRADALLEQAFLEGGDDAATLKRRSDRLQAALRCFTAAADGPNTWTAQLGAGRCLLEMENLVEARRAFEAIVKSGDHVAARTAKFELIRLAARDPQTRDGSAAVVRGCREWRDAYPGAGHTPEGRGVCYTFAAGLVRQASSQASVRDGRLNETVGSRALLHEADELLKPLARSAGEYAHLATVLRSDVLARLSADGPVEPVDRFGTATDCYDAAEAATYLGSRAADDEKSRHFARAIDLLERGLIRAVPTDLPDVLLEARTLLAYLQLLAGNWSASADAAETAARSARGTTHGAKPASYAAMALVRLVDDSGRRNATSEEMHAARRRLTDWVRLMEVCWPREPETDAARISLADRHFADGDYLAAAALFANVPETSQSFTYAAYRQALAAQLATNDRPEVKQSAVKTAIVALQWLSDPPAGSSPETLVGFCHARLQLANLYRAPGPGANNWLQVEQVGTSLRSVISQHLPADHAAAAQLLAEADRIRAAAAVARATAAEDGGQTGQARQFLAPVVEHGVASVAAWRQSADATRTWFQQNLLAHGRAAALDLRLAARAGDLSGVKTNLELLRGLFAASLADVGRELLRQVVNDLAAGRGSPASKNETGAAVTAELAAFFADLAKQGAITAERRLDIARGFSALGRHDRAAAILSSISTPGPANDASALAVYHVAQLALAREHRLGGNLAAAKDALRGILGTAGHKGWGYDRPDARREAIAVLAAAGEHAAARSMASLMVGRFERSAREFDAARIQLNELPLDAVDERRRLEAEVARLTRFRESYFEFYRLEQQAAVRDALTARNGNPSEVLTRVAARLVKLEQAQPDLGGPQNAAAFQQWLEGEPSLRERYVAAGGRSLVAGEAAKP